MENEQATESTAAAGARPAAPGMAGVAPMDEHPARRPARLTLYLGVTLLVVGAIVLYVGYNGTATNSVLPAQIPFIVSGGFVGLGLLVLGGIALAVYAVLAVQADFRQELREVQWAVRELAGAVARSPAASSASPNGVVAARGASSFHRPGCRIVRRAGQLRQLPRDEADRSGLAPCRVCEP